LTALSKVFARSSSLKSSFFFAASSCRTISSCLFSSQVRSNCRIIEVCVLEVSPVPQQLASFRFCIKGTIRSLS
jgi:hypothetical protein